MRPSKKALGTRDAWLDYASDNAIEQLQDAARDIQNLKELIDEARKSERLPVLRKPRE